jgi:hypothetical protein
MAVVNENNPPRISITVPRSDAKTSSYEDEGAGFRELKAFGDDPLYWIVVRDRIVLRNLRGHPLVFSP